MWKYFWQKLINGPHFLYSSDLALSGFCMIPKIIMTLIGRRFEFIKNIKMRTQLAWKYVGFLGCFFFCLSLRFLPFFISQVFHSFKSLSCFIQLVFPSPAIFLLSFLYFRQTFPSFLPKSVLTFLVFLALPYLSQILW